MNTIFDVTGSLGIFLGIAFRAKGIANSIVELAFGLTFGSLAVVIARGLWVRRTRSRRGSL